MTRTTYPGRETSFPQRKESIPHQPRRTRWQEVSCLAGRQRTTMTMTMRKPKIAVASAMIAVEMMVAATTTAVTPVRLLRSSAAKSQTPIGGRSQDQADRFALGRAGRLVLLCHAMCWNEPRWAPKLLVEGTLRREEAPQQPRDSRQHRQETQRHLRNGRQYLNQLGSTIPSTIVTGVFIGGGSPTPSIITFLPLNHYIP
jgi:hypothetical protein